VSTHVSRNLDIECVGNRFPKPDTLDLVKVDIADDLADDEVLRLDFFAGDGDKEEDWMSSVTLHKEDAVKLARELMK